MKFTINEVEYKIKSKHAIEILNIVEKSGLLDSIKDMKAVDHTSIAALFPKLPQLYQVSHDVLSTALGTFVNGVITKNPDIVDEMEALEVPMYAVMIIKGLIYPISYVLTDDKAMADEKKKGTEESVDTSLGKPVSNSEPTA